VVSAILLAWVTTEFVENRFRFGGSAGPKTHVLLAMMTAVGMSGLVVKVNKGFANRDVEQMQAGATLESGLDGGYGTVTTPGCGLDAETQSLVANCLEDGRNGVKFALLGDSKAEALAPGVFRTSTPNGRWLFIGGNNRNGAPAPLISDHWRFSKYQRLARPSVDAINRDSRIQVVALVTAARVLFHLKNDHSWDDLPGSRAYDYALEAMSETVSRFVDNGKEVVLVEDNPPLLRPEDCTARTIYLPIVGHLNREKSEDCALELDRFYEVGEQYLHLLMEVKSRYPDSVQILNTADIMCDREENTCRHVKNGRMMYSYTDHISDYAAGIIGKRLNRLISGRGAVTQ
jgi:hypothetical protein